MKELNSVEKRNLKLLKLPVEDLTLNRIKAIRKAVFKDSSGEYLDCLMEMILEFVAEFPLEQSISINNAEQNLEQARFWLNRYYEHEA